MAKKTKGLRLLGRTETRLPAAPSADILETFPNPARRPYWIRFESADFTSLCPITGQADFAQITIDYLPGKRCLETKSLKFYLASYRNQRAFNEADTNRILDHLVRACAPRQMIVQAEFASRGGISLTISATHPDEPERAAR
ncbi:MAG: preQ(1) synthase [Chthoniobacterales bacterium]